MHRVSSACDCAERRKLKKKKGLGSSVPVVLCHCASSQDHQRLDTHLLIFHFFKWNLTVRIPPPIRRPPILPPDLREVLQTQSRAHVHDFEKPDKMPQRSRR